jgi:hypothetical protein
VNHVLAASRKVPYLPADWSGWLVLIIIGLVLLALLRRRMRL